MTEKEKAKAYDEAIERAKKLYGDGIAEGIFPELKESEDDRIRKWIIDDIRYNMNNEPLNNSEYKKKAEKAIDWLENQGRNSTDKIEPRFKVGDWFVNKFGDSWHIDSLDKKNYQVSDGKGNYNYFPISKQDEMHLWNIQDAKDGDVLADEDNNIGIFQEWEGMHWYSYTYLGCDGQLRGFCMGGSHEKTHIHPATKEQWDLLFQKIKEAGYEWDAEKKELKKLVEPKFKVGDKIVNTIIKYMGSLGTQCIISEITDDKYIFTDGSCMFINNQDSWELSPDKEPKFDPKTLKAFDKVLVRDFKNDIWKIDFYSCNKRAGREYPYRCVRSIYSKYCIPCNDGTKHLVGTTDEAPEYYRYWED